MAGNRVFDVKIDLRGVERLADQIGKVSSEDLGRVSVDALNAVIEPAYELARERMRARLNLTDEYIMGKMSVSKASRSRPVAEISARGGKKDSTLLSRYDAQAVNKNRVGAGNGGVIVEVKPGRKSAGLVPRGFLLPLRNGNGMGVFARSKAGQLKHRYGPSPAQDFNLQLKDGFADEAAEALQDELVEYVGEIINRNLA